MPYKITLIPARFYEVKDDVRELIDSRPEQTERFFLRLTFERRVKALEGSRAVCGPVWPDENTYLAVPWLLANKIGRFHISTTSKYRGYYPGLHIED